MKHLTSVILACLLSACSTLQTLQESDTYQYISAENQAAFDAYILLVASKK